MSQTGDKKLGGGGFLVAILVIGAWLALLIWLVFHIDVTEIQWSRLLVILGSLEAVAFAAAGAVFGTTVQRQRVQEASDRAEKAEGRAREAEKEVASNSDAASKGRTLAAAVKARAERNRIGGLERVGSAAGTAVPNDLVELATHLFPD